MARAVGMISAALAVAVAPVLLPYLAPLAGLAIAPTAAGASAARLGAAEPVIPPSISPSTGSSLPAAAGISLEIPNSAQPLRLEWSHERVRVLLPVRNDSSVRQKLTFDVTLHDRLGNVLTPEVTVLENTCAGSKPVSGIEVSEFSLPTRTSLSLQFPETTPLPAVGFLRARSIDRVLWVKEINIPEKPGHGTAGIVFSGCLIAAGLLLLVTIIRLRAKEIGLLWFMGSTTWNFQQSWGTNTTLASALLGIILTAFVFPENPRLMPKASYTLLQSLFAALTILAPLLYGLFRRRSIDNQGYVGTFLLAGGIVLWCALGQAVTLFLLMGDFVAGNSIDLVVGRILQSLAVVLFLLLVFYGLRALYETASQLGVAPTAQSPSDAAKNLAPTPSAQPAEWPLL